MGVLDRFEKGIERAVNGAFAKAFRSEVQPVEIASALRKEVDDKAAVVGRDRTVAPNDFVVELGKADHDRLQEWQDALAGELSSAVHDYATQQRYAFVGPVRVVFEEAGDLDTGVFRVRSTTTDPSHAADQYAAEPFLDPPQERYAADPGGSWAAEPAPAPAGPQPAVPGAVAFPFPAASPYPAAAASPYPGAPGHSRSPGRGVAGRDEEFGPDQPPAWASPPPQVGPQATLEIDGVLHRIAQAVTVIGRGADVDVSVEDPGVSRRHAEVHLVDGRVRVIDLGSTNGTFVDGERIHAGTLTDGSTITVGRTRIVVRLGQW